MALVALLLGFAALFALIGPQFGYSYAVVKSGSMAPAYGVGAVIVVDEVNPSSVQVGDVVSFRLPERPSDEIVTHRVVEVLSEDGALQFRTKGDANEEPDPRLIEASQVKGRIVFGVPWIGRLAPTLQAKGLFFLVVLACGGLLIAGELANIFRELRGPRERPLG